MKGIFFTEFLHMVEAQYSANMVDDIIEAADLPSKGAYTIVGAYSDEEIVSLMQCYAEITQLSIQDILKAFGRHLFKRLFPIFTPATPFADSRSLHFIWHGSLCAI